MKSAFLIYKSLKFDGSVVTGTMASPFSCVGAVVLDPEHSDGAVYSVNDKHGNRADYAVQSALSGDVNEVRETTPVVNPLGGEMWKDIAIPAEHADAACSKLASYLFHKHRGTVLN